MIMNEKMEGWMIGFIIDNIIHEDKGTQQKDLV